MEGTKVDIPKDILEALHTKITHKAPENTDIYYLALFKVFDWVESLVDEEDKTWI